MIYIYIYLLYVWKYVYICTSKFDGEMHVPCRSRQMHVELADRVWKWLAFANEFSRFASCPFHCHPSCIAWLVFGLCFGFSIGLVVSGLLLALWIFRVPLCHFLFPAPAAPRNRLAQYLE